MATYTDLSRFSPEASGDPEAFEKLVDEQEEEEEDEDDEEEEEKKQEIASQSSSSPCQTGTAALARV